MRRVRAGDACARKTMIEANLGLVASVARRYVGQGLPFSDVVQEGSIGLIKAVDRFDHRRGCKFSTYATWWIRQAISEAVEGKSRTIRLPAHVTKHLVRVGQAERRLAQELGREPTPAEIARETGLSRDQLLAIRRASERPFSLDTPVGDTDDQTFADLVPDDDRDMPFHSTVTSLRRRDIESALAALPDRERRTIRLRFGLDGHRSTLDQVGRVVGLSCEGVRRLEARALDQLAFLPATAGLREYLTA